MGGVLYNGCGAADTVSKLKPLKTDMCTSCKAERTFYLARINLKIHVFFIPTIPLNKKYGIVCSKCKTGCYITEEQMRQFMIADEKETSLLFDTIMHPENAEQEAAMPQAESALPEGAAFCGMCGQPAAAASEDAKPLREEAPAQAESVKPAVCQHCGSTLPEGAAFCGVCGQPATRNRQMTDAQACTTFCEMSDLPATPVIKAAKPIPMEETGAERPENKPVSLCPQCGKAVEQNAAFCGFCGAELHKPAVPKAEPVKAAAVSDIPKAEPVQKADAADIPKETALKAEMPVQSPPEEKDWKCPLCDTLNPADTDCCQLCGLKRS